MKVQKGDIRIGAADMRTETHNIKWRGIDIEIIFMPERFCDAEFIELRSEGKIPLPITETGYRGHCIPSGTVAEDGGAVAYIMAWLDREAERTRWDGAQLSLF